MNFTQKEWKGVIAGMVLGDGNIQWRKDHGYKNPSLRFNHSLKQKPYMLSKLWILKDFFNYDLENSYYETTTVDKSSNTEYGVCCFHSRVNSNLKPLYKKFYPDGEKYISREVLDLLNPLGIAIWYMDDGCYNEANRTVQIGMYTSKEECQNAVDFFNEEYGITWKIAQHQDKYYLTRGYKSKDVQKFFDLIRKHIHPEMMYKLGK